jgi:hypothetical protein
MAKHLPIEYNKPHWPGGLSLCPTMFFIVCVTCKEGFAAEYFCRTGAGQWEKHLELSGSHWWAVATASAIKWAGAPEMWEQLYGGDTSD